MGGRNLIVNTADNDSSPSGYSGSSSYPSGTTGTMPVAPVAAAPARTFGAEDVNGLLASLTNAQLSDIIMQFKVGRLSLLSILYPLEIGHEQSDAGLADLPGQPGTGLCHLPSPDEHAPGGS